MSEVILSIHDGEIYVVGCPPNIDTIIVRDYDNTIGNGHLEEDEDGEKFMTFCIPTSISNKLEQ